VHRKLPPYEVHKRLYLEGWTHREIADAYGTDRVNSWRVLKEESMRHNEYPLQAPQSRAERIRRVQTGKAYRGELTDASGLLLRLAFSVHDFDGSLRKWSTQHGLRYNTVSALLRGTQSKVSRPLADRLTAALDADEIPPAN
jgi:hypothetical protein